MKMHTQLGVLLLAVSLTLLTGCQKQETPESESSSQSSTAEESTSSQAEPEQEEADVDLETVKTFIEEHLPPPYLTSSDYKLELEDLKGGTCQATIHLDMRADGSDFSTDKMDEIVEVIQFESYYVAESCLENPPVPLSLKLVYLLDGEEMATVEKISSAGTYIRTFPDGRSDIFRS